MSKFMTVLALGTFALGLSTSASFAGSDRSSITTNGVVFEKQECPEGETWNEEKKACEKKAEVK